MKFIQVLKSKLNNATVTDKKLKYQGSIGIDSAFLKQAHIFPAERVQVLNYNNGSRIETYVIPEEEGSGKIILYGPAARSGEIGDKVCILSYYYITEDEAQKSSPLLIELSEGNRLK